MKRKRQYVREPSADELAEKAMFENPVASVTDCTGFVPRIPDSHESAKSYNDIHPGAPVTALDGSEAYTERKIQKGKIK